jgi:hypothetical protein
MNTLAGVVDQSAGKKSPLNSAASASCVEEKKLRRFATRKKFKFVATSQEETEFWEDVT